jgi:hypothetical protein
VLAFAAGFIVGGLLREAVLLPWLRELEYNDPRTTPPLGELEPTNWGGANQPSGKADSPDWWPTGFTTDLPNYPSKIDIGYLRVGYALDENDAPYIESSVFVEHATRNDLVVGTIVERTEQLDPNFTYITRQTFTNIALDGSREDILQLISDFEVRRGPARFDISPLAGPSPGRPYPAAPSSPGLPNPFRPAPEELPQIAPKPFDPWDLPFPYFIPSTPPQTLPQPEPVRRTLPSTPTIPQTIPKPAPVPQIAPKPATTPRPVPVPIPLLPNFQPAPAPLPPVTQAPAGLEVPWPGADPIGQPSKRPPPTLTGIATELGKLEQKMAQIGDRGPGTGGPGFDLQDLIDAIKEQITEPEEYIYPAGSYVLEPVCDYDTEGNLLSPISAEWPAGEGRIPEILGRLGAIAELLQIHKELRQPVCRGNPPQGQPVTVTFEEEPA